LASYLSIVVGEGLPIQKERASAFGLQGLEADTVLLTEERVIDTASAKAAFKERLARRYIQCEAAPIPAGNKVLVNGEAFDGAVDCTSGELGKGKDAPIFFEPAAMAEYEGPTDHFALTVMDGYFPCLYPTATPGLWRVSHVFHTARGAFDSAEGARKILGELDAVEVTRQMTEAMTSFYPDFAVRFRPLNRLAKAVRTKLKNNNASREFRFTIEDRVLRIFSGKICSVFMAEQEVFKWLETL
jgi:hypothetical protein